MTPTPRPKTYQTTQPEMVPPPVGGLNGRDPVAAMGPLDAYTMDNIIPGTARVYTRNGCEEYIHDLGAPVQTLEVYSGAAGDSMLAWAGTKIFDVSTDTPAELATARSNALAIAAMFSNAADNAQHMIIVNGADTPQHFDGAAITDLAITGITSAADLNFVKAFKERLYFAANQKLGFYYLAVGAIQGAISYFDLAQVSALGGYLQAIATVSPESNGEALDDYIVFITSKGELIVYNGYDPSSASNWSLVGRYFTAIPVGQRCAINYNSELVILTKNGAMPFSAIRNTGSKNSGGDASAAITAKLGKFLSTYMPNINVPGWMGTQYQSDDDGWLMINVPASSAISGSYYHYIMNTKTNAWCRFTDWNGICFTVFNEKLYFGCFSGQVMLGDSGKADNGVAINVNCKTAYNSFSSDPTIGAYNKHFQWGKIFYSCEGSPSISMKLNINFKEEVPNYPSALPTTFGVAWDTVDWDTEFWASEAITQDSIITFNRYGFTASLWLRMQISGVTFEWLGTQILYEKTRGLLI